ncbi:N-acetyltransferase [Salisediminibacterium halotolerans]|uniref:N-acetyltransferase n=1 Tax=Salisediminibacterium halotolerans TaxID=517425 RepID=UPI000EB03989|nr:N-acetyltransferase [Salisediminibacterium halotolerans]RLJ69383.1 acetoin utilization protein AcuA [Actinophytocola xinjiangensis]RPE83991.1 acetoin utilization protein AcuA [Salisediminibacterium halotolerans]TWG32458.1 acetoin utilization protein AcuA [Salisediminibacterium halotolerans]GEL08065.1 acetoin utilization protein AcuA [Salisediminibacterium halotolerans]
MKHKKTYHSMNIEAKDGKNFLVEGPVSKEVLEKCEFDEGLVAFRKPVQQQKALIQVLDLPESRIIVARDGDLIVGYATYLYPDPLERWSEVNLDNLIELGAIEVSQRYRGYQLAKNILKVSMMDEAVEDYIIITTEYYWHWDLRGTGLSIWQYRDIMEKVMKTGGLEWYATDDPEITSHPANCLMARIGKRVKPDAIHEFDRVRFKHKYMI